MITKQSTWIILGVVGVGLYLYITNVSSKLAWVVQNINVGINGLLTSLTVTMLVTNATTSAITVTGMLVTVNYNGATIGSGLVSTVIQPGQNSIPIQVNLSDFTILSDIAAAAANGITGSINITIAGSGKADNLPVSFTQTYSF